MEFHEWFMEFHELIMDSIDDLWNSTNVSTVNCGDCYSASRQKDESKENVTIQILVCVC